MPAPGAAASNAIIAESIVREALGSRRLDRGDEALGDYLRREVLGPGALYPWNDMIERATGEPLTSRYFVEQFAE